MSESKKYDAIVIGVGTMGSAACYYLAKQGCSVLGLDQFFSPHDQGAHWGQSRIIRKAYFEHTDYVPLLKRAYENWEEFENDTGIKVYYKTGLIYSGNPEHAVMKGVRLAAEKYSIPLENTAGSRFPQFKIPAGYETVYEPDAGFLVPEKTIALYIEQSKKLGAVIGMNEKVLSWEKEGRSIKVVTQKNIYHAARLIITAGPWAGKMIPGFSDKLKITRQVVTWMKPTAADDFKPGKFPCWMIADEELPGVLYGFPYLSVAEFGEPEGLKMAHHYPGSIADPDSVNRIVPDREKNNLIAVMQKYLPGAFKEVQTIKTCLYANTPDENFIIDLLPGYDDSVAIACGFSGHGFKFASVVGEILADLVVKGKTLLPIDFLRIGALLKKKLKGI